MPDILRPALHFTPPQGWINDPNGTLWVNGEYHLFYQADPDSIANRAQHWGHAVSADLLHWEHLPTALCPDGLGMIWSGSAVYDRDNASGLGREGCGPIVAAYTNHGPDGAECQSLAFSNDGGRTFTKYEGNPVLAEPGRRDFRDPRVIRYEPLNLWVMAVASGDRLRLYHSENLRQWRFASEFGPVAALGDAIWECPDLFELPYQGGSRWVFTLSTTNGGPGWSGAAHPAHPCILGDGPGMFYFVGSFDGTRFVAENGPLPVDYGRDFYAAIGFYGSPQPVWIGWQNCWPYSMHTPADTWRGMMSLPRELSVAYDDGQAGLRLVQQPCAAFEALPRAAVLATRAMVLRPQSALQYSSCGQTFEIALEMEPAGALEVELFASLRLIVDADAGEAALERIEGANDCEHPLFAGERLTAPLSAAAPLRVRLVVDTNAVEVFLQEGRAVISALTYPLKSGRGVAVRAAKEPCALKEFAIRRIQTT